MARPVKKKFPNKVDFYITNVCNLACENCNRFNNYKFTGFQRWDDYRHIYQQWAEHVELSAAVLLGGEPLLNPTICDWVQGIPETFGCDVQILTNGTRLNHTPGLYNALADLSGHAHVGISLHNVAEFENLREIVKKFLQGSVVEWGTVINEPAPANLQNFNAYWGIKDSNGIVINLWNVSAFHTAAIQFVDSKYVLHNTTKHQGIPSAGLRARQEATKITAHEHCGFVKFKSYHFIKGKLYKCGPAALFPEFDEQHKFDIVESDRQVIHSYKPLSMDNFIEYHQEFFDNLDNPIPQCRFCPTKSTMGARELVVYPPRKNQQ